MATLYVNSAIGNDATTKAANTASTPWATVGRAVWGNAARASASAAQAAAAGDTVIVAAGTYTHTGTTGLGKEDPYLTPTNSGTVGNPITIKASGIVSFIHPNYLGPQIGAYNKNYIIWDGFTINENAGTSVSDTGPVVIWQANNCTIKNCTINGRTTTFGDNHCGVRIQSCDGATVQNCHIQNILDSTSGDSENSAGVMTYFATNVIVEKCTFTGSDCGVFVKGDNNGPTDIRYNLIYNQKRGVIVAGSDAPTGTAQRCAVYENIMYDVGWGVMFTSYDLVSPNHGYVINNTIQARTTTNLSGVRFTGNQITGVLNCRIANNIFVDGYNSMHGEDQAAAQFAAKAGPSPDHLVIEHNVYHNFANNFGRIDYSNYTFAGWKTFTGTDVAAPASLNSDPLFIDKPNRDFRLQTASPARMACPDVGGLYAGATKDAGARQFSANGAPIQIGYVAVTDSPLHVAAGGDLQAALNAAIAGDTVTLEAGAVFTGNYTLPVHAGTSMVTVRCINSGSLPSTGYVNPVTQAANMATIRTTNGTAALTASGVASNWTFLGVIFEASNAVEDSGVNIVILGDNTITLSANLPENITFDRCAFRVVSGGSAVRGLQMQVRNIIIQQCHFSNIRSKAAESQALCAFNSPGPFTISQNYIGAAAIGILFGGQAPGISGCTPSNIIFNRNYVTREASWVDLVGWGFKNLFELKNARDVTATGNIFENNWPDGQAGAAIVFTVRANGHGAGHTTVRNVNFTNNQIRSVGAGFNILGLDDQVDGTIYASTVADNIVIHNNLIWNMHRTTWNNPNGSVASGRMIQIAGGPQNVHVTYNTFGGAETGNIFTFSGVANPGFKCSRNIFQKVDLAPPLDSYGVKGDDTAEGNDTLATYCPNVSGFADTIFEYNVLAGCTAASYNNWPTGNLFPSVATLTADYTNTATGNYRLVSGSAYTGYGVDQQAVENAYAGISPIILYGGFGLGEFF